MVVVVVVGKEYQEPFHPVFPEEEEGWKWGVCRGGVGGGGVSLFRSPKNDKEAKPNSMYCTHILAKGREENHWK